MLRCRGKRRLKYAKKTIASNGQFTPDSFDNANLQFVVGYRPSFGWQAANCGLLFNLPPV
jgi:hypothetical protein